MTLPMSGLSLWVGRHVGSGDAAELPSQQFHVFVHAAAVPIPNAAETGANLGIHEINMNHYESAK